MVSLIILRPSVQIPPLVPGGRNVMEKRLNDIPLNSVHVAQWYNTRLTILRLRVQIPPLAPGERNSH